MGPAGPERALPPWAVFVIVANILVDIAYTLLDPRVRLS
jgi:ABC-type dipeptide/oligopeptide/nickel transport system permease component